jgi:two-component system KDP operon response regulator KdpE
MPNQTILLVDDDTTLRELLSDHLQRAGYRVLGATDGRTGLQMALQSHPDLIIMDLMMPGMDGWELCQHLRPQVATPIIMLTAKGEEFDKLRAFQIGVDDYVTKPFSFAELVARAGAVLARSARHTPSSHCLTSGALCIDYDQRRVTVSDLTIDLTPTEYRLLETLAKHAHRTISSEQLLAEVWGSTYGGDTEQVKHFIWTLRKKIETDPGDPKHLLTERGFGYRFE